jgi:hypothetical protein
MQRLMILLALAAMLLASCSGNASGGTPESAEAVHQAWVAGLQQGDRQALLAIADTGDLTSIFVDSELNRMRDYLQSSANGPLQSVDVRAPEDTGAGKQGLSVWHFAQTTICWRARLAQQNGAWKVTSWGIAAEACKGET